MKICFFVADITFKGGIERVLSNLTSALVKLPEKPEVTIVSQYKSHEKPHYVFDTKIKIEYLTDTVYSGAPKSISRLFKHLKNISVIRTYFNNNKFDVISSQSFPNTVLLWLAGIPLNKVIAVEHVYYGYYNTVLRNFRKFLYSKLSCLGVLTNFDKQYYNTFLNNVVFIPNPIDASNKVNSELFSKKIIAIGRLEKQKNFSKLIEIFAEVIKSHPDWSLHIYGEGTLHDFLQRQIDKGDLGKNIILEGTSNHIEAKMTECSFLVMSSLYEGFGMVLIEAMKNGLPCISYDCPAGPADIIKNGFNGLLVPNQNEEAMVSAINYMIENPDVRKLMGNNALKTVDKYDSNFIAIKWYETFRNIIQ